LPKEKAGTIKRKSHSGNIENMIDGCDKDNLINEVNGYAEGTIINWSELARRYNVTDKRGIPAKNGGQMIQDFLVNQGINVTKFKKPIAHDGVGRH
jgi:hypothetical protein